MPSGRFTHGKGTIRDELERRARAVQDIASTSVKRPALRPEQAVWRIPKG